MAGISGVCEGNAIYDMTKQSLQGLETICSGTGKCATMINNYGVQLYTEQLITHGKYPKIKIILHMIRKIQKLKPTTLNCIEPKVKYKKSFF